jgi:hypothetical protein
LARSKEEASAFEIHPVKRHRMSETPTPIKAHPEPELYEIRVRGHLDARWSNRFENLTITLEEDGDTLLTGPVVDQAALHGLLKKMRDLGLPLVSVVQAQFNKTHSYRSKKEIKMNTNNKTTEMKDRKVILSTLWIFATLNYLYADVFNLFFNPAAQEVTAFTQGALLVLAILMETAIAMVLLSRVLKHGANRWTNIAAGIFHTAFVSWSLFGATQPLFYMFFAAIEIPCTLLIVWYAWKWTNPEG